MPIRGRITRGPCPPGAACMPLHAPQQRACMPRRTDGAARSRASPRSLASLGRSCSFIQFIHSSRRHTAYGSSVRARSVRRMFGRKMKILVRVFLSRRLSSQSTESSLWARPRTPTFPTLGRRKRAGKKEPRHWHPVARGGHLQVAATSPRYRGAQAERAARARAAAAAAAPPPPRCSRGATRAPTRRQSSKATLQAHVELQARRAPPTRLIASAPRTTRRHRRRPRLAPTA